MSVQKILFLLKFCHRNSSVVKILHVLFIVTTLVICNCHVCFFSCGCSMFYRIKMSPNFNHIFFCCQTYHWMVLIVHQVSLHIHHHKRLLLNQQLLNLNCKMNHLLSSVYSTHVTHQDHTEDLVLPHESQ